MSEIASALARGGVGVAGAIVDLLAVWAAQASVVLLLGLLVSRVLSGASATLRHAVWATTLLAVIALPPASRMLPARALTWLPATPESRARLPGEVGAAARELPRPGGQPAPGVAAAAGPALARATGAPATGALAAALALLYVGVALAGLAHSALGLIRLRALTRRAEPPAAGSEWCRLLDSLPAREGIAGTARVLVAPGLPVPLTWGVLRPVVLLPRDAAAWQGRHRRNAVLHELAHVERADWAIQTLARVACALLWFHPLVWLAARRLALEAERACDDRVLAAGAESSDYAEQLLALATGLRRRWPNPPGALPMARSSHLPSRIKAILDPRQKRSPMSTHLRAAVFSTSCLLAVLSRPFGSCAPTAPVTRAGCSTRLELETPGSSRRWWPPGPTWTRSFRETATR